MIFQHTNGPGPTAADKKDDVIKMQCERCKGKFAEYHIRSIQITEIDNIRDYLLCDVCKAHFEAFLTGSKLFREVRLNVDANQFDLKKIREKLYKNEGK